MENNKKNLITNNENNNDIQPLSDNSVSEIISNIIDAKKLSKRNMFYLYHFFNIPVKTCAKLSGYSESYAYKLLELYRKKPILRESFEKIIDEVPDRYRQRCKARLIQVAKIEGKALNEYDNEPRLAIEKPALLKHIKQAGGAQGRFKSSQTVDSAKKSGDPEAVIDSLFQDDDPFFRP